MQRNKKLARLGFPVLLLLLLLLNSALVSAESLPLKDPALTQGWLKIDIQAPNGQQLFAAMVSVGAPGVLAVDEAGALWVNVDKDLYRFDGNGWTLMHSFPSAVTAFTQQKGLYLAAAGNVIYRSEDGVSWKEMFILQPPSEAVAVKATGLFIASDNRIFIPAAVRNGNVTAPSLIGIPSQFGEPLLTKGGTGNMSVPAPSPTFSGPAAFFSQGFEDADGNVFFSVFYSEEGTANMGGRVAKIDKNGAMTYWDLCKLCLNPIMAKDVTSGKVFVMDKATNRLLNAADGSLIDPLPQGAAGNINSLAVASDGSVWLGGTRGTIWQKVGSSGPNAGQWVTRPAFSGGPSVAVVTGPGGAVYAQIGSSLYQFIGHKRVVAMSIGSKETLAPDFSGDSRKGNMDVAPQVINGRTMVPVRFVAQGLGYEVSWAPETRTVVIKNASATLSLPVGGSEAVLETSQGKSTLALDVPAQVIDGRTMVPIRFVAQAFNARVFWNGKLRQVIVVQ